MAAVLCWQTRSCPHWGSSPRWWHEFPLKWAPGTAGYVWKRESAKKRGKKNLYKYSSFYQLSYDLVHYVIVFQQWERLLTCHGPRGAAKITQELLKSPRRDPYHKGERPRRQGSVVVDAVSHTHLHLSLLDPVAGCVVQQTHYSVHRERSWSRCFFIPHFVTYSQYVVQCSAKTSEWSVTWSQ